VLLDEYGRGEGWLLHLESARAGWQTLLIAARFKAKASEGFVLFSYDMVVRRGHEYNRRGRRSDGAAAVLQPLSSLTPCAGSLT
jgi:hypothetical protein